MSKYTVRTTDGELRFASLLEVEKAWLNGFIAPEDEICELGSAEWKKAGSLPLLQQASQRHREVQRSGQPFMVALAVGLSILALGLMFAGKVGVGAVIALVVAVLLFRVTTTAFSKPRSS